MYYIAVYDVGEKRVGKMLKLFRRYLHHIQNSVFEGELTDAAYARLKDQAQAIMHPEYDSILFFSMNGKYLERESLGNDKNTPTTFI